MPAPRFFKEEKSYKVISTLGGADSFRCRLFLRLRQCSCGGAALAPCGVRGRRPP